MSLVKGWLYYIKVIGQGMAIRGDYNSLTCDIFRSFWLNVRPLIHYLSNAMYGCLTKFSDNVAIDGFWMIISANL